MSFEAIEPLSDLDVEIRSTYTRVLQQIRLRLASSDAQIDNVPSGDSFEDVMSCEKSALQLRKVLELIVLSSLVSNRESLEAVSAAFRHHDRNANNARKLVRIVNPNYWPVPAVPIPLSRGISLSKPIESGYLTEDAWGHAFGMTSELVHATSPYRKLSKPAEIKKSLADLASTIRTLLNEHYVVLVGGKKWVTGRLDDGTGKAQAGIAQRLEIKK
jgi:hypothetical protein